MSNEDAPELLALLIPILSVILSLGALIVWIVVWYRRRVHEVDCLHQERMAAIEKGLELPPVPLPQPPRAPPRSRYLLRGLIWLAIGIPVTFGGREWLGAALGGAGWIAVAVGCAYLVFYFVEERKASLAKGAPSASGGDDTP